MKSKHTQRHEHILLCQELNRIALLSRTRTHKISSLVIQPGNLEQVQHIVDVILSQSPLSHSPAQVRVAVEVVLRSGQHGVDVRVAARAQQVVHAAAVLVLAIPCEAVGDDGDEGPHVGEVGPEAVVGGDVGGVKLAGAGGPEAFTGVVAVPDVEIAFFWYDVSVLACNCFLWS